MNRWFKVWLAGLTAVLLAISLSACGGSGSGGKAESEAATGSKVDTGAAAEVGTGTDAEKGTETDAQTGAQSNEEAGQTKYPLTVTDASGQEITFEKAPEKIVSLNPSETEVLFALGLGDQIVGVDDWSDFPEEAKAKTKVGGMEVNSEVILDAEADLVVGGLTMNGASVGQLRELGLTVFAGEPKTVDQVMEHIELLGKVTNRNAEAAQIVAKMKEERQAVLDVSAGLKDEEKRSVYIEFSPGWTVGKGEFMDELITLSGGKNVADQPGWYEISEEKIIERNPQVILYSKYVDGLETMIKDRAGWGKIDAIANHRIAGLDDNLVSRPGPRVTQGLLEVAKAIYPEKFK